MVRRLAQAVVLLLLVVTVVFGLSHLAANPVDILLPPGSTPHQRAVETRLLGLNRSIAAQYWIFLRHAAVGHFGTSTQFHVPILSLVASRSLVTLRLAIAAIVLAIVVGVPIGILMAVRAGTWIDHGLGLIVGLLQGVASFWLAVILIFLIGVDLALAAGLRRSGILVADPSRGIARPRADDLVHPADPDGDDRGAWRPTT